jgi:CRISPR/Cas system-associated protein Cas5 (RAMP superfamily)
MEISPKDNIELFTESLYNKYYGKSNNLNIMLNSLKFSSNIPYEILSKYYARIYTDNKSRFYSDINKDLRENKKENYISFIKVLYEGVKLKSLPLSKEKVLYRGSLLLNKEIDKIRKYLNNKVENLPGAIIFSKSFLSFSKNENIAKFF